MRVHTVAVLLFSVAVLAVPQLALGQMRSPVGGTSTGAMVNSIDSTARRPLPAVPSTTPVAPDSMWIPDRYVQSPLNGQVLVPGHWERRVSDHQVLTPPLVGHTMDGGIVTFPAGTRPPVGERQAP
jgi:hypothetical protein